jgi:hypothetical protein
MVNTNYGDECPKTIGAGREPRPTRQLAREQHARVVERHHPDERARVIDDRQPPARLVRAQRYVFNVRHIAAGP